MGAGSTYSFLRGAAAEPGAGATYSFLRGAAFTPGPGATYSFTREDLFVNGLIRGPQFQANTIGDDRFINRLTSVLSTTSVDLAATGINSLLTVPSNKLALIQGIILRVTNDPATTDASISIGVNPSTVNIFSEQQLLQLRNTNDTWSLWSDKSTTIAADAAETIDLDVTVAATGTLLCDVYVIGLLI